MADGAAGRGADGRGPSADAVAVATGGEASFPAVPCSWTASADAIRSLSCLCIPAALMGGGAENVDHAMAPAAAKASNATPEKAASFGSNFLPGVGISVLR